MLVSSPSPDSASRAAIRLLKEWLPGASAVEGSGDLELSSRADQPQLISAEIVEGKTLRAVKVPGVDRTTISGFGAFLDGTQKVRLIGRHFGVPIVLGTTSAAVRVRVNRRLVTWGHQPPRLEQKLYLPLKYLPPLTETLGAGSQRKYGQFQVVDTSIPDASGAYRVTTRPETYDVQILPPDGSDLLPQFVGGGRTWLDANTVTVRSQNVTVDVKLQRGVVVKGVIRSQAGIPLEGASVNVSDAQGFLTATYTDETGTYSLAVPTGKYTFDFFAPFPSQVVSVEGRAVTVDRAMTMDVTLADANP